MSFKRKGKLTILYSPFKLETWNAGEIQNYTGDKSNLAILEQIQWKLPIEQWKLWETVGDRKKWVRAKKQAAYSILGTHTVLEH